MNGCSACVYVYLMHAMPSEARQGVRLSGDTELSWSVVSCLSVLGTESGPSARAPPAQKGMFQYRGNGNTLDVT